MRELRAIFIAWLTIQLWHFITEFANGATMTSKYKTWAELNDQRDAFLKVPWIEFIKESYIREEKHSDRFNKKIAKGWKPECRRIYDPETIDKSVIKNPKCQEKAPTPYYTDPREKEHEENYRWVKSPRYCQVPSEVLRQSARQQLDILRSRKYSDDFLSNSSNVKAAIYPPRLSAMSSANGSRASSRASVASNAHSSANKKGILKSHKIIFESLKKKIHEDRGFILQSKRIMLKAFDNFDAYRSGVIKEQQFQDALSMIGVGNGKIDALMMQSIVCRFKKIIPVNSVSGKVEQLSGIDYKQFVRHYILFAQEEFNKILRVYGNEPGALGRKLAKRSAPIGPL